jgi:hypothetical protein
LLACWLVVPGLSAAQDAPVEPAEPSEVEAARLQQEDLVEWQARTEVANRKIAARDAFFAGQGSFATAFPDLVESRLDRLPIVRGRLVALEERAAAREKERQERLGPADDALAALIEEARRVRSEALAAESAADDRVRRLLAGIVAHLERHPEWTADAIDPLRAPLEEAVRAVDALPDSLPPEERALREAAAAAADADLAALSRLQRDVMLHAVAERDLPSLDRELDALSDPLRSDATAARLSLLRPWLDAAGQAAIDEALAGYMEGPALAGAQAERQRAAAALIVARTEPLDAPLEVYEAQRDALVAEVASIDARMNALPAASPRRTLLQLERDAAADWLEVARIHVERVTGREDDSLDAATAAADRARQEADAAAATAADDQARAVAAVISRAADARGRVRDLKALEEEREAAVETRQQELASEVAALRTKLVEVERSSPLGGPNADDVYRKVRRLRSELIDGPVARGEVLATATEKVAEVRAQNNRERQAMSQAEATLPALAIDDALADWDGALDDALQTVERLEDLASRERHDVLEGLQRLSEIRRELRGYVSWAEREKDQRELGADVARELRLLGPTIQTRMTTRFGEILQLPWRLISDGTVLVDFFWGLFWMVVLLGGWFWGRGKSDALAGRIVIQARRLKPDLRPIDAQRLRSPAADAIKATIDLTLGYLMVSRISPLSPEIAFVVETWLLAAIYRALLAIFDLAVVRAPEFRPSLVAFAPATYDQARFTARVAIIWGIARGFTWYILWSMLQLDTVAGLAMTMFNVVGLVLLVGLLYQWDPLLRERVRARNQDSQLVAFLSRDVPNVLRPLSAAAMVLFFGITLVVDLTYFLLARDRTGLGRLFNVISRYQMGAESDQTVVPIPDETIEALCQKEPGHPVYIQRPGLDDTLDEILLSWEKSGRRGMVALVGDRGEGKRTEIARFLKRLETHEPSSEDAPDLVAPLRCKLTEVVTDERVILDWIAEVTGAAYEPGEGQAESLIEGLIALPRRLIVVEQAHRAYSRLVGGFEAISTLLYVLNATSHHHFWLVSFHRPGWHFLQSVPSIVDVGVFRAVVSLDPFDAPMLRELTRRRSQSAGLQLDYRTLMRGNLLGADPEVELERSINAFYRLLAEASEGNPRVAMHLFTACLEPGEKAGVARVQTRKALGMEVATDISVDALFTLTALRQEDAMSLGEIAEVTNLPVHTVRNTVRDLVSRGLVEATRDLLYIPIVELPRVTRTLRRRHLLHLGA